MKSPKDPVDHARTTRPHAGETMKDTKNLPALVLLGIALVSFVGGLAAFGSGHPDVGTILVVIAAVVLVISLAWFLIEHRRVRKIEERWYAEHPDTERQRPTR
ncbi:protein UsfY [Mycobacterium sp. B14F4]|uniref:protein UsfY n=1 Tax=Mycobacterium sp. B14F4 TaxID=3153565 RepID=UPI00325F2670